MTEFASGAHLTTSRVNRLLRPLRNKCNSLATLPKSATTPRVAYSKQSSTWDPDCAPLAVFLPLPGTKRSVLDRRPADELELSMRIRAICDAFKNVVYIAYGQPCNQCIPSLAAMCTLVIGGNMPTVDSGENSADESNVLDMDDVYEAVPPHYRRFLIVSHALSMILRICTHHHTLVIVLLDHCLSFGLVHESTRLLNIILAQAFSPAKLSYPPPATHPAHTNYLLDLHAKWTTGSKPSRSSTSSLPFTTSTFCQAVLGAILQSSSHDLYSLWTSKVLNGLLHVVESCDLGSYMDIIHTLCQNFWEISNTSLDAIQDDRQVMVLRDKLSELMSSLFGLLFTRDDAHPPLSRIYAAIDILSECYAARLHCLRVSSPGSSIDLPDMIITFATHIFVTLRNSIDNPDRLLAILDDSSPVPTTFSKLVEYFGRLRESQALGDFLCAFLVQLKMYSSTLCSEQLFGLDASLWACALRHFETSIVNSPKGSSTLVTRYKQQLMEAVDAAERRCFGRDMDSSPVIPLSIHSKRAKRTKRGRLSGHWEWEDMVGSWIRKTPVHKKRKVDNGLRLWSTVTSNTASRSISPSTPLLTHCRRLPTLSPTSPSQHSDCDGSDYQDESDKENYSSSPPLIIRRSRPLKRRSSNFFSLLADAQTNRIVLHPRPNLEPRPPSSVIPEKPRSSQGLGRVSRKREQKASCRKALPLASSKTLLPSDDSLDLFAYATSSPARL